MSTRVNKIVSISVAMLLSMQSFGNWIPVYSENETPEPTDYLLDNDENSSAEPENENATNEGIDGSTNEQNDGTEYTSITYSVVWEGQAIGSVAEQQIRPDELTIILQSSTDGVNWVDGSAYTIGKTDADPNNNNLWGPVVIDHLPLKDGDTQIQYRVTQELLPRYFFSSEGADASHYDEENNTFIQTLRNTYQESWNYKIDLEWYDSEGEERWHKSYETYRRVTLSPIARIALSTQKDYPAGSLEFRIPYYLFANTGQNLGGMSRMAIGPESNPTSSESITYYIDNHDNNDPLDDEIVFYNYKDVLAGANIVTTVEYKFDLFKYDWPHDTENLIDFSLGELKVSATGQYEGQQIVEELVSNTIDYFIDDGHNLYYYYIYGNGSLENGDIDAFPIYSNTTSTDSAYKDIQTNFLQNIDFKFDEYVYVLYKTYGTRVTNNQPINYQFHVTVDNGGEVIAATPFDGPNFYPNNFTVTFDAATNTYVYGNEQVYSHNSNSDTLNLSTAFLVRYPVGNVEACSVIDADKLHFSYDLDTVSADEHEGDKGDDDDFEYGHAHGNIEAVYTEYKYEDTDGYYSTGKSITNRAVIGSLTKLEGGIDANDAFSISAGVNGYYTGKLSGECPYTLEYPEGKFPYGYRLSMVDDIIEVYPKNSNNIKSGNYTHLTENDYELNVDSAPVLEYSWENGLDFSTGLGITRKYTTEPFELYAKTSWNGKWNLVQSAKDEDGDGKISFDNAIGKHYVAYKVVSPKVDGQFGMRLTNIDVTYKADSELLQSYAKLSDESFENYVKTLQVVNIGAYRIDAYLSGDSEETVWANKYTVTSQNESSSNIYYNLYNQNYDSLHVQWYSSEYNPEDKSDWERLSREDIFTRASGFTLSKKDMGRKIDTSTKTVNLMTRLNISQVFDGAIGEFGEDIDDENELREVVFYDLLPEGYYYNPNKPVYAYTKFFNPDNSTYSQLNLIYQNDYSENRTTPAIPYGTEKVEAIVTSVETIDDYEGTGRQMVIFHVKAPDGVSTWAEGEASNIGSNSSRGTYHSSSYSLTFYATGSFENIQNGGSTFNFMSVQKEDGSDFLANGLANDRKMDADPNLYKEDGSKVDFSAAGNVPGTKNTFYANDSVGVSFLPTYESGIRKQVKGYSGVWGTQDFSLLDDQYRYQISLASTEIGSKTSDIVIYDILETALNAGGGYNEPGMWQGTFESVNLRKLRQLGIEPQVWYSTQSGLLYDDFSDVEYLPENHPEVWSQTAPSDLSTVTAIAVDCRKTVDDTEFVLNANTLLSFEIVMHAPEDLQEFDWAYNLVAYNSTFTDANDQSLTSFNQSNRVKIELDKYCEFGFTKYLYTGNDDEKLPLANATFRLYKCNDTSEDHIHTDVPGSSESCWIYQKQDQSDTDGNVLFDELLTGDYAIVEVGMEGVINPNTYWTFHVNSARGTVTDPVAVSLLENNPNFIEFVKNDDDTYELTNSRELTKVEVVKNWVADAQDIPEQLNVTLYRDGEEIDACVLNQENQWSYLFTNLDKYDLDDGHEYVYTTVEEEIPYFTQKIEQSDILPSSNIKITFDVNSASEQNNDLLSVYYRMDDSETWNYVSRSGQSWDPIILPTGADVYFFWRTDSSLEYWGFAIDDVVVTDEEASAVTDSRYTNFQMITTTEPIETNKTSDIYTDHIYNSSERKLWHMTSVLAEGIRYTFTNTRSDQLEIHKRVMNTITEDPFTFEVSFSSYEVIEDVQTLVPVTRELTIQKFTDSTLTSYETISVTPDANGKVTFTLKDDEVIRFTDLPPRTIYTIHEEDRSDYLEEYQYEDADNQIIGGSQGVYLKLHPDSETEGYNYDYFSIFYQVDGQWYILYNSQSGLRKDSYSSKRFAGTGGTMGHGSERGIYVPTTDFYIYWNTDRGTEKWGFEFTEATFENNAFTAVEYALENDGKADSYSSFLLNRNSATEVTDITDVKTEHPYKGEDTKIWHVVLNADDSVINGRTTSGDIARVLVTNKKYISLPFTKVNYDGEIRTVLSDVTFDLYVCTDMSSDHTHSEDVFAADSCYQKTQTITSDDEGNVIFTNLLSGNYILKEISAPVGVDKPDGYWRFTIDNGEFSSLETVAEGEDDPISNFIYDEENGFELENLSKTRVIEVNKTWIANEKDIPAEITYILKRDGDEYQRKTVTSTDGWSYTFDNLPAYDLNDNHAYTYTVEEAPVDGFMASEPNITNQNLRIHFNENSKTYNGDDILTIYLKLPGEENYRYINQYGRNSWGDIIIPGDAEVYFYWRTNYAYYEWGFEIDSITSTSEALSTSYISSSGLPSMDAIETSDYKEIRTSHYYGQYESKLWKLVALPLPLQTQEFTNTRLGYFDVHKEVQNSDTEESFAFTATLSTIAGPYTEDVTYRKYESRNATTFETLTANPNNEGKVTFELANGEWVRFINLPLNLQYTVNESVSAPFINEVYAETATGVESDNYGVYLVLDPRSKSEAASDGKYWDYFAIYYQVKDQWYVVYNNVVGAEKNEETQAAWMFGREGDAMGVNHVSGIYVPTTDFYVAWRSDSNTTNWGFEFVEANIVRSSRSTSEYAIANDIAVKNINSLFSPNTTSIINVSTIDSVKTSHWYSNSERKIWHVTLDPNEAETIDTTYATTPFDSVSLKYINIDTSAKLALPVEKTINGTVPEGVDRDFVFTISAEEGTPLPTPTTVSIHGAGTASFANISYSEEGTYIYTVEESGVEGVDYSNYTFKDAHQIIVTVSRDDDDQLVASWEDRSQDEGLEYITFANDYQPHPAELTLPVEKNMLGNEIPESYEQTFDFVLSGDSHSQPTIKSDSVTVENSGRSETLFKMEYTEIGTYVYTIEEVIPEEIPTGYRYDIGNYQMTVEVIDEAGTLTPHVTILHNNEAYTEETPVFENQYKPIPVDASITVEKAFDGDDIPESSRGKTFSFTISSLTDQAPMPEMTTIDIVDDGTESFGAIQFTKAGTYRYVVREEEGSDVGYSYSKDEVTVTITVVDNNGILDAQTSIEGTEDTTVIVTNIYHPTPTQLRLPVSKVIIGDEPDETDQFEFILTAQSNEPMPERNTVTVIGEQNAYFDSIEFDSVGEYVYTISEINGGIEGYTYDTTIYEVCVEVVDNGGHLEAHWEIVGAEGTKSIVFTNERTKPTPTPEPSDEPTPSPTSPTTPTPTPNVPTVPNTSDPFVIMKWGTSALVSIGVAIIATLQLKK